MNVFLAFLPALGWGLMPIIAKCSKGNPNEQLLGTTITAFLFGSLFFLNLGTELSLAIFIIGFLSGVFWSIGQYFQFLSFVYLPVSEAMPISNGTQLIGTTLVSAFFFKEWNYPKTIIFGVVSILIIILGIFLTSYHENVEINSKKNKMKIISTLFLSSVTLTIYVVLPTFFGVSGKSVIFPQAIGMVVTAVIMNLNHLKEMNKKSVLKNLGTGLSWSVANVALFIIMPILGVGRAFTISQLSVLVSLSISLVIFKVSKTKKEKIVILTGAILITIGILMVSTLKK